MGSAEQRLARLADPARRAGLRADMDETGRGSSAAWDKVRIAEVALERNYRHEGRSIGELARERGCHPVDAFLDLAVDEQLRTRFAWHDQHVPCAEILRHPATHVSLSDGGAHTRYQTSGAWPTVFLVEWVRERALMPIEDAIWKMSALPAWIAGFLLANLSIALIMIAALYLNFKLPAPYRVRVPFLAGAILSSAVLLLFAVISGWGLAAKLFGG